MMVLILAIGLNYISFKYEDYSKIHTSLLLANIYSFIRIVGMKLKEDEQSSMSQEFLNITLVVNSNFVMVTTVFINSVYQKYRLHVVIGSTVTLYTLVLIN